MMMEKTKIDVDIVHIQRIGIMTLSGSSIYRYRRLTLIGINACLMSLAPSRVTKYSLQKKVSLSIQVDDASNTVQTRVH
jgi:hypothetical protein